VALPLALAEPHAAPRGLLNGGSPAAGRTHRHCRRTTTRDTTLFPVREPLAIPQLPFMHNVRGKGRTQVGEARLWTSP
jgi:hypothetical protein